MLPHTMIRISAVNWFLVATILTVVNPITAQPPDVKKCYDLDANSNWSNPEKFVWRSACVGAVANFNKQYQRNFHPGKPDKCAAGKRHLSSEFMETILFGEEFQGAITRQGIRIVGACFSEKLDLSSGELPQQLGIRASRFENGLDMKNLNAAHIVSLTDSFFEGDLLLNSARIGIQLELDNVTVTNELVLNSASIDGSLFLDGANLAKVDLIGVRVGKQFSIMGAVVRENMHMDAASIGGSLLMSKSAFGADLTLRAAKIAVNLEMNEIKFANESNQLRMDSSSVGGSLHMRNAVLADAWLLGAEVGGQAGFQGAQVKKLVMDLAEFGESLSMDFATFGEVILRSVKVGNQVSMVRTEVKGKLNMNSASVGSGLIMGSRCNHPRKNGNEKKSSFNRIDLSAITIARELDMIGSEVRGYLDLDSALIGGDVYMRSEAIRSRSPACDGKTKFSEKIDLIFAKVGANIDLAGGEFKSIDLSGTEVRNELRLLQNGTTAIWDSGDQEGLILRNTRVGALVDTPESWPDKVELGGFVYTRLGGLRTTTERSVRELVSWLNRDNSFSFQPYEQLASTLRAAGRTESVDEVLFAGKKRERESAKGLKKFWFLLLEGIIGHGIGTYMFRAFYWSVLFVFLGWALLVVSGERWKHIQAVGSPIGFWFSLDYLLPITRLRDAHFENVTLSPVIRWYFHIHQIIGYVLASFVIAGLGELVR